MSFQLRQLPHPHLHLVAWIARFPAPLAELAPSSALRNGLEADGAPTELPATELPSVQLAVRDALRGFGYKPTGRGKPASEYLQQALARGGLSSINAAVDACNAASLHSGLPISLIDLERAQGTELHVAVADAAASYVFNASGQHIELGGLPCLFDREGPCANAVKDSQRTKTHAGTRLTLSLIWGARAVAARTEQAAHHHAELLRSVGALLTPLAVEPAPASSS